jgi:ABC-type phosphate transport system substrate-binding protein
MKKERTICSFVLTFWILSLGCGLLAQQKPKEAREPDVAVIVNPLNPIDSITSTELRKIFSGERQGWSGGLPVTIFVRAPQSRERDVLLSRVLHMTESEYKAYWVQKVYSGEVQREPLALPSNGMQLEAIRAEKGGIALISIQDIHPGVKVLKVDGHLPGTPGYPLK